MSTNFGRPIVFTVRCPGGCKKSYPAEAPIWCRIPDGADGSEKYICMTCYLESNTSTAE